MIYALVKNGVIVEGPRNLPQSWGNFSGLPHLPQETLKSLGWLPWVLVTTPTQDGEILAGSQVTIEEDRVVETQLVRPQTEEEKAAQTASRIQGHRESRAAAYATESDPLWFKAQRGEIPIEAWHAKVEEIRQRYPY